MTTKRKSVGTGDEASEDGEAQELPVEGEGGESSVRVPIGTGFTVRGGKKGERRAFILRRNGSCHLCGGAIHYGECSRCRASL